MRMKPTVASFIPRYLGSIVPLIVVGLADFASRYVNYPLMPILVIMLVFIVGWVLRSREVTASLGLFIVLYIVAVLWKIRAMNLTLQTIIYNTDSIGSVLDKYLTPVAFISSILVVASTELYRRSITYEITEDSIRISGGLIRKQVHSLPYDKVGRVVLERGILARLLGYGTIIPVGVASWGEEYYTRGVGVGGMKNGVGLGVGYARTLQEISRDPLKVLYGVPNPAKVYEELERRVSFMYEAEKRKVSLLESIDKKLGNNT